MPRPARTPASPRTYRGTRLEERRAARRAQLIDAGLVCFGGIGYQGSSVRAICAEAGLTERYFYESFPHSEALLCAVYDHLIEQLLDRAVSAVEQARPDPLAMARAALEVYLTFNADPRVARVTHFEILGVSETVDQRYRRAMDAFAALIEQTVQPLSPRPEEGVQTALVATGLVGAVVQIAMQWFLSGYRLPQSTILRSALSLFEAVIQHTIKPVRPRKSNPRHS